MNQPIPTTPSYERTEPYIYIQYKLEMCSYNTDAPTFPHFVTKFSDGRTDKVNQKLGHNSYSYNSYAPLKFGA